MSKASLEVVQIKKVSESLSRVDRDQAIYFESQDQHTYGLTGNFQRREI